MDIAVARDKSKEKPEGYNGDAESLRLRQYAERCRKAMLDERKPYEPDWMQVSLYIDPTRGRFNEGPSSGVTRAANRARKRSRLKILNNTATISVRTAAAGFCSHMTSKSRPWFQVQAPDESLADNYDVRVYMDSVTAQIRGVLAKSNFYKAMPDSYTEDIMFGAMAMLMPEDDDEIVRFQTLTAGTFAARMGANGKADGLYREFDRTARQLRDTYGLANLPQDIRAKIADNKLDDYYTVCALIERNPDERPGMGPLGLQAERFRPWREIVWIQGKQDTDKHGCMKVNGYYEQPFVFGRFNPCMDEVYSSGPCLDALGDVKGLQYLEGQKYRLIDLMAEPPLGLPDSMRNTPSSLAPRSKTYLPINQNGIKAEPMYTPKADAVTVNANEIREHEARIKTCLFTSLFLMLNSLEDRSGRTATEIAERRDELGTVLGPTVEVVTDEYLDPVIVRVFRVLERRGMLPAPPQVLAELPLKIEYTSILAQAAKAAGLQAIERSIGFAASIVQATGDPTHFDKIDFDQAQDEFSARISAPATIIRSDEAVAQIREGRAQQQRLQQVAAMAKPAADAANAYKTLSETVPQEGSAADGLAGALAGAQQ